MSDYAVYRLYDAFGACLYVGRTVSPRRRFAEHATQRPWWDEVRRMEWDVFPDLASASAEESRLTYVLRPRYAAVLDEGRDLYGWAGRKERQRVAHEEGRRCIEPRCRHCKALRKAA